jgi:two-component system chemotaxis response regulator CheB
MPDDQPAGLTGYICPRCGGALSRREDGHGPGADEYRCRIGHAFTAAEVWIEHCAMRNRALGAAARALAENGDLARALAAITAGMAYGSAAARSTVPALLGDLARSPRRSSREEAR